ncbi:MAG: alpha/beta fold hydrolase [Myxococcales bacterium]|nr:alpha/beta fold hydrolase [Myxococcales bacterium]
MKSSRVSVVAALLSAFISSCASDDAAPTSSATDTFEAEDARNDATGADSEFEGAAVDAAVDAAQDGSEPLDAPDTSGPPVPTCDATRPIVVMAHGFLASGDTWAPHTLRFLANGWCPEALVAFDWNTVAQDVPGAANELDATIDAALAKVATLSPDAPTKVVLVGHSAGGGLGVAYLSDATRAAKVSKYVHVGSTLLKAPPEGVPTLNLWSEGDAVIGEKGNIEGATNVMLETEDHFGVATSTRSFEALYAFVAGGVPTFTEPVPTDTVTISGRAVAFGDNKPSKNSRLRVWEVDPTTATRVREAPDYDALTDDLGHFGPLTITPGAHYELLIEGPGVPVHYYREPFLQNNPLVYLRTLPPPDAGLAGALLSSVPFVEGASTLVAFIASRGLRHPDDTLTLDGVSLLSEAIAAPAKTLIALFLYDGDSDPSTQGAQITLFEGFPFLGALDSTNPSEGHATFKLNDRSLAVRRWPGDPDGAVIAIFD